MMEFYKSQQSTAFLKNGCLVYKKNNKIKINTNCVLDQRQDGRGWDLWMRRFDLLASISKRGECHCRVLCI